MCSRFSDYSSSVDLNGYDEATASDAPRASEFWKKFCSEDFRPDPRASLQEELNRLGKRMGWNAQEKRQHRSAALQAEVALHSRGSDALESWQALCIDVGVAEASYPPPSITRCRKVSAGALYIDRPLCAQLTSPYQALEDVRINICNLLDHRRNSDIPLLHFKSRRSFARYTRAGRSFPKEIAKEDGIIRGLLRRM